MKKVVLPSLILALLVPAAAALAQSKMDDMKGMDMAKKPTAGAPMAHKAMGTVKKVDAKAGVVGVALKRGSLFGRAPVVHDLTLAFTLFGFLDESPDPALVDLRKELFASAAVHYAERRAIVDLVPEATLRMTPMQVAEAHAADWRRPLGLTD